MIRRCSLVKLKFFTGKVFANKTITFFILAVSNGEVWLLDRVVFQKIMMSTGKQRLMDQIKFLKAVPLLKNLPDEILNRYKQSSVLILLTLLLKIMVS